jgi:uncharacterized protein YicC (UPF0701 family)
MNEQTGQKTSTRWLTVAEAATQIGISERAIQRRCKSGKLRSRLIATPTGQQWEIDPTELEENTKPSGDSPDRDDTQRRDTNDAETTQTTEVTTLPTAIAPTPTTETTLRDDKDLAAKYVAQLETENRFLRAAVEARDRDAAELRAALRKALEAMPKQITSSEGSSPRLIDENAQDQDKRDTKSEPPTETISASKNGVQRPARREPRPLWKVILGMR